MIFHMPGEMKSMKANRRMEEKSACFLFSFCRITAGPLGWGFASRHTEVHMLNKVGIVTYHRSINYGAVLQAYALAKALLRLGCQPEVIDYQPAIRRGVYTLVPFWSRETFRRLAQADGVADYAARNFLFHAQKLRRNERFQSFIQSRIPMTAQEFGDIDALRQHRFEHAAFVCGSDQIWNSSGGHRFDPGYYLDFVAEGRPRIAYAPSFGSRDLPEDQHERVGGLISKFTALSAREQSGVALIQRLTGREATRVLDPTLLLTREEWLPIAADSLPVTAPYVLCYCPAFSAGLIEFARQLRRRFGYRLVAVDTYGPTRSWLWKSIGAGIHTFYEAGPAEFLHLVAQSQMVLTTTFHGTAFALNFQKPFLTWLRPGMPVNTRIEEMLQKYDLSERIVLHEPPALADPLDIDYHPFLREIAQERADSIGFLRHALQ